MSKEQAIQRLWETHWANDKADLISSIQTRFTREAFNQINKFITDSDNLILEVACGTGRFCGLLAQQYPHSNIIGVDLSPSALGLSNRLKETLGCHNLSFVEANLFQLPYPDSHFDVVFSEGVVQHFSMEDASTYQDAIREMLRVTKANGKLIISVVNWHCYPHTLYKWLLRKFGRPYEYGFEKSFKRSELVRIFKEMGLAEIEVTGYYPSHGLFRLSGYSRLFFLFGKVLDAVRSQWFIHTFGFEIVIKGKKVV
jgi:ubiquinone/menaquinone biosynthesis C-methylase UbiE